MLIWTHCDGRSRFPMKLHIWSIVHPTFQDRDAGLLIKWELTKIHWTVKRGLNSRWNDNSSVRRNAGQDVLLMSSKNTRIPRNGQVSKRQSLTFQFLTFHWQRKCAVPKAPSWDHLRPQSAKFGLVQLPWTLIVDRRNAIATALASWTVNHVPRDFEGNKYKRARTRQPVESCLCHHVLKRWKIDNKFAQTFFCFKTHAPAFECDQNDMDERDVWKAVKKVFVGQYF